MLAVVAAGFWSGWADAPYGVAAVIVGLLLLSVRDEYDLVTWLAPRRHKPSHGSAYSTPRVITLAF